MPNLRNAKKALNQSRVRAVRNANVKGHIDTMRRSFRKLLEAGKIEDAQKLVRELDQAMDKAVTKHVFKANTAARVKSRTMLALNKAAAAPKKEVVAKKSK
ncbi:MAG: 30S ribosomal protein S20 [Patescibacteria group bacterium]|mgnify:CR=1 FL=1